MTRILFCLLALTLSVPPASAQVRDGDFGPFVLEITYGPGSGNLRQADLSITTARPDGDHNEIDSVVLVTETGQWHVVDSFLSSGHEGSVKAEAVLPEPESVILILFLTESGYWEGWPSKVHEGYANQETSYFDQSGRRLRTPPCDPRECLAGVLEEGGVDWTVGPSSLRISRVIDADYTPNG